MESVDASLWPDLSSQGSSLALPRISSMVKHIEAYLFIQRKATSHDERSYVARQCTKWSRATVRCSALLRVWVATTEPGGTTATTNAAIVMAYARRPSDHSPSMGTTDDSTVPLASTATIYTTRLLAYSRSHAPTSIYSSRTNQIQQEALVDLRQH